MIRYFTELTTDLSRGINSGYHFMENEVSTDFKMAMPTMETKYHLVTPINHRANNSERANQKIKNHFIAGICRVDKYLHLQFWDILLQQETISINFLRQSRIHPHLSSYMYIFGEFYYNHTLLDPPETRILIHNRPNDRASWAPHGEYGRYIRPAMEH